MSGSHVPLTVVVSYIRKRNILYQGPIHAPAGLHRIIVALSNVYADCLIELSIHAKALDKDYLVQCKKAVAASEEKNKSLNIRFEDDGSGLNDGTDYSVYDVVMLASDCGEISSIEAARAIRRGAVVLAAYPGETGLNFPVCSFEFDENSIAETIWTLLVDEDLRSSMIQDAEKAVEDYFSPDRQIQLIQGLVDQCSITLPKQKRVLLGG